jgi:aspartyl-tRNA(Asn)/glutamyl-tRNA(Gln) amidotransferase subunit C
MPGPIDPALVARLADLAQVELPDAELARVTGELAAILAYADELASVDVEGVAPMDRPFAGEDEPGATLREDAPRAEDTDATPGWPALREAVLAAAPRAHDGGFDVPSFVDEG